MADTTEERIESKKNNLDLRPMVEFVAENTATYAQGLQNLLNGPKTEESQRFADAVKFENLEQIIEPQVSPEEIRGILSVMPPSLVRLSKLETIGYIGMIPVPVYDKEGNFSGEAEWVNPNEFPRPGDHPSRILVGLSNGSIIYQTPIPKSVSTNKGAVKLYQVHVFLHEFFHTIENLRRDSEKRKAILLEYDGEKFTFQDFWDEFEGLCLGEGYKPVSRYAATYADRLNHATKARDPDRFTKAMGEQTAEAFVGYMLGILPNDNGYVNFSKGQHEAYKLMNKLRNAEVLIAK